MGLLNPPNPTSDPDHVIYAKCESFRKSYDGLMRPFFLPGFGQENRGAEFPYYFKGHPVISNGKLAMNSKRVKAKPTQRSIMDFFQDKEN